MNSSPPRRAGVSMRRTFSRITPATAERARSPTRWPYVSLSSLSPSRSAISTQKPCPYRVARSISRSRAAMM